MVKFSKVRLEGRALEHALAGDKGPFVRMFDVATGKWVVVKTEVAKTARRYMAGRAKELLQQLCEKGFFCSSADVPVTLHAQDAGTHGKQISVDVHLWCQGKGEHALVEVKWGRRDFKKVQAKAKGCIPKLKAASLRGRWSRSDRRIAASLVGALSVSPSTWALELQAARGRWKSSCTAEDSLQAKAKPSGKSNWQAWRKGAAPGDKPRWPSGRSGGKRKSS